MTNSSVGLCIQCGQPFIGEPIIAYASGTEVSLCTDDCLMAWVGDDDDEGSGCVSCGDPNCWNFRCVNYDGEDEYPGQSDIETWDPECNEPSGNATFNSEVEGFRAVSSMFDQPSETWCYQCHQRYDDDSHDPANHYEPVSLAPRGSHNVGTAAPPDEEDDLPF
jgi:hypothetical protein